MEPAYSCSLEFRLSIVRHRTYLRAKRMLRSVLIMSINTMEHSLNVSTIGPVYMQMWVSFDNSFMEILSVNVTKVKY